MDDSTFNRNVMLGSFLVIELCALTVTILNWGQVMAVMQSLSEWILAG